MTSRIIDCPLKLLLEQGADRIATAWLEKIQFTTKISIAKTLWRRNDMILNGTYHNGTIVLDGEAPFAEGETIQFEIIKKSPEPLPPPLKRRLTAEEILEMTSKVKIDTRGWKFNREEANERR